MRNLHKILIGVVLGAILTIGTIEADHPSCPTEDSCDIECKLGTCWVISVIS
jgi:hypothetical protein